MSNEHALADALAHELREQSRFPSGQPRISPEKAREIVAAALRSQPVDDVERALRLSPETVAAIEGMEKANAAGFAAVRNMPLGSTSLSQQPAPEVVKPSMLEMAEADDEARKWERRWHALNRMYAIERCFADQDGRWGLRDFLNYVGQVCGYFPSDHAIQQGERG